MADVFCLASNDEDFVTVAECTRRTNHEGHHCDTRQRLAWDADGPTSCLTYDHGQPPNRAARRGTRKGIRSDLVPRKIRGTTR